MTKTPPGLPLRDYAALGDGRTVALVAPNGRVDWLPLPNLDSVPVFARILDEETGGSVELVPREAYESSRRYIEKTNVLETTFTTAGGVARVTDAMVTGVAGRLPWAEFARRVEGLDGSVEFTWQISPGTMLGTKSPWLDRVGEHTIIRCGQLSMAVVGSDHGPASSDPTSADPAELHGHFTTTVGSRHLLVLTATEGEPLRVPDPAKVDQGIDRTIDSWLTWSDEFSYEGPWSEQVQRSALALKLLIHSPTGAIAAAATSSLPENPAGGKNWDYRFAWIRDLAYTAHSLTWFGLREETHAAISWLLRTIREQGPDVLVMYSLGGSTCAGVVEYDVPGWRGIGPVVSGNPAQGQLQLGIYGDLIAISRTYVDDGNLLDVETARLLAKVADKVCDEWRSRDAGMWELGDEQHYTSSKMGCWQALTDAIALAEGSHINGDVARWKAERDRIHDWTDEHCWSEDLASYVMHPGTDRLDASVLLHAPSGFDRGERMSSTIDALTRELGQGSLLYRYSGVSAEEHTFVACAFWRVSALACVGRHEEAVSAMDDLVTQTNDVGLLAEMIAAGDGAFWGNLPQGLSHLALINAALMIKDLVPKEAHDDR
ncbi:MULTISPECIES: glycoside hydrolase family 15 protein [unclassified Pseudoclavibacter]|uniref:glycoside hydrolase family 15 protein n=1 Tax=unclassified Pseudoclavibacter TaxID=2615177 RepID=UPI000CE902B0|nr:MULTISPECIES: glycoside hydrolase family 15 protein [unclassified Pseudoclavibacter]MBS3177843.1 glycoside hydrolase family 15 protein [Pseudoclavibacter sp. Marseille-Q4354]PPG29476.1 glycoside hydrolase family 15 protein [Pseudoclavibacter sp. RFBB5]